MSTALLFLHGVGQKPGSDAWRLALEGALQDLQYPSLADVNLVEPNYLDLLSMDPPPKAPRIPRTEHPSTTRLERRRRYEVSQASMRRLLGLDEDADGPRGPFAALPPGLADTVVDIATSVITDLQQAARYMRHDGLQNAIVLRLIEELPDDDELVIIGHSLGSLVAIDLLEHLPPTRHVRRLITIGSPAGLQIFHDNSERLLKEFPYGQVKSWLNVLSPLDYATAGRGLSPLFPAAHDLRVDLPAFEHGADAYLRQPKTALAVGEALFGALGKSVVQASQEVDVRPTEAEYQVLFGLSYAHMTLFALNETDGERVPRYREALTIVQASVLERLREVAVTEERALSPEVLALDSGLAPPCPRIWNLDFAVHLMVVAATTNLIAPWEVEAHKAARLALGHAAVGLGLGAQQGSKVSTAITEARSALGLDRDDWSRLLIAAGGAALLMAGPVGLLLAAPAGLAGAAAITSALAAFGPGGMVGGMALAGTMVGTGAVTATSALVASSSSAVVETEVLRRMAHARARHLLGLSRDPTDWMMLAAMQSQIATERERLAQFSDSKSMIVQTLDQKAETLRKAVEWMLDNDLGQRALPAPEDVGG